eukprot:541444-Amorphochlora_amoeboformis.AAC.1
MSGVESIDGLLAKFSGLRAECCMVSLCLLGPSSTLLCAVTNFVTDIFLLYQLLRLQESPEVQLAIPQIQQSLNWALTLAEKAIASQKERKSKVYILLG